MTVRDEDRRGKIITFYSYKGGTGRSMALANVAFLLANAGKRVLAIDWDLEAPGLHRYFEPFLADKNLEHSTGVIDFVRDFATAALSRGSAKEATRSQLVRGIRRPARARRPTGLRVRRQWRAPPRSGGKARPLLWHPRQRLRLGGILYAARRRHPARGDEGKSAPLSTTSSLSIAAPASATPPAFARFRCRTNSSSASP